MKSLLSLFVLGAGVTAQGLPAFKPMPLPPVTGDWKTPAEPMLKPLGPGFDAQSVPAGGAALGTPAAVKTGNGTVPSGCAESIRRTLAESLLVDSPRDGEHWVRGPNFKAGFDRTGFEFFAAPADTTQPAPHAAFRLQRASVAGRAIEVGEAAPELLAHEVRWQRGGVVEAVALARAGVEQSFTFAELPARGPLEIVIAVDAASTAAADGGLVFADGAIRYGAAVAIDARGDQVPAATTVRDGAIVITVPDWFVERAAMPLVVDPVVASSTVTVQNYDLANADLVWDTQDQTWMVVWEMRFSAFDTDVFAQRLQADMTPVGGPITIDVSSTVWQLPSIANLGFYHRNLVVAQVSADDVPPYWVGGRVIGANGAVLTNQLDIEKAGVASHASGDKLHPRVGGDPCLAPPTYFTVVWERVFSATDHDIHAKQVDNAGVLRAAAPTMVANSATNQSWPSISKSDGPIPVGDQRFVVVFQQTHSPTDEDVYGALMTWDGQVQMVNGNPTFPVYTGTTNDIRPRVATPNRKVGTRETLVVFASQSGSNSRVCSSLVNINGSVLQFADLAQLAGQSWQSVPQTNPTVDGDGIRFLVAFDFPFLNSPDQDVRALVVAATPSGIAVHGGGPAAYSTDPESRAAVASVYTSSGSHDLRYGIADQCTIGAQRQILAQAFRGAGPGVLTTRATGCGSVGIGTFDQGGLGETTQFQVSGPQALYGFLVGFPVSQWTPACPACTLGADGSTFLGTVYNLTLPPNAAFAGVTLSVQGFAFGGGPCLGSVALSDTIDLQVR